MKARRSVPPAFFRQQDLYTEEEGAHIDLPFSAVNVSFSNRYVPCSVVSAVSSVSILADPRRCYVLWFKSFVSGLPSEMCGDGRRRGFLSVCWLVAGVTGGSFRSSNAHVRTAVC